MEYEITLDATPAPRGQANITATTDGQIVYMDLFNPADAEHRHKFLQAITKHLPGLNGQERVLESRLMDLAVEVEAVRATQATSTEATPKQGRSLGWTEPEPWPDPVNGAELLDGFKALFERFLVLPEHGGELLALWSLYAWCFDCFDISPILAVTSPEKQCGKSRLLDVLGAVVRNPLPTSNISTAALFRIIEQGAPTVLIDEGDAFLEGKGEEMRGLLNAGWSRGTSKVQRVCEPDFEVRSFSVWAPKAIAAIGTLPETVESRSIILRMERKTAGEPIERLRLRKLPQLTESFRRQAARWVQDNTEELMEAEPEAPAAVLNDRMRENVEVLIAVGDVASGKWPEVARVVVGAIAGIMESEEGPAVTLLGDIQTIFTEQGAERIPTEGLLASLKELPDRPWDSWSRGKGLNAYGLSRLLRRFRIKSDKWKVEGRTVRGYVQNDFKAAIARYLPDQGFQSDPSATGLKTKENSENQSATQRPPVADWKTEIPLESLSGGGGGGLKPPMEGKKTSRASDEPPDWTDDDIEHTPPKSGQSEMFSQGKHACRTCGHRRDGCELLAQRMKENPRGALEGSCERWQGVCVVDATTTTTRDKPTAVAGTLEV